MNEIRIHIEMEEQENLEAGMPPEEAHYAALRGHGLPTDFAALEEARRSRA
jgi:hypothetical protein